MKKIIIYYWNCKTKDFNLNYEHNQEIPYSVDKRNEIIDEILNKGYNLMIRSHGCPPFNISSDNLVIYISQYSFGQR
jgi:hypothetical protein